MPPRFFVPDAGRQGDTVTLPDDEAHHLRHVLRLATGEPVGVFDGAGGEWRGRVGAMSRRAVVVDGLHAVTPLPEPAVRVTLVVGLLKGEAMDHVVRDAVALGVRAIAPLRSGRVALPARARRGDALAGRWRRVAIAAAKQCGRAVVPDIGPLVDLDDLLDAQRPEARPGTPPASARPAVPAAGGLLVMAIEPGGGDPGDGEDGAETVGGPPAAWPPAPESATVLIGPEGGWAPGEIERARARGAWCVTLGPRALRAELAPAVCLSALWTRWGW